MSLSNQLKTLREDKQLTQQEIADTLGISKSAYIKYERGEREPKLSQLYKIAAAFNVSVGYLLGTSDNPEPLGGINLGSAAILAILQDPDFFNKYGENCKAVKNLTYSFLSHILLAYYGNIDLLYMEVLLIEKFEEVYNTGRVAYASKTSNVNGYESLLKATLSFRKQIDEFLGLLQNPDFYKKEDHFTDSVKTYKIPQI